MRPLRASRHPPSVVLRGPPLLGRGWACDRYRYRSRRLRLPRSGSSRGAARRGGSSVQAPEHVPSTPRPSSRRERHRRAGRARRSEALTRAFHRQSLRSSASRPARSAARRRRALPRSSPLQRASPCRNQPRAPGAFLLPRRQSTLPSRPGQALSTRPLPRSPDGDRRLRRGGYSLLCSRPQCSGTRSVERKTSPLLRSRTRSPSRCRRRQQLRRGPIRWSPKSRPVQPARASAATPKFRRALRYNLFPAATIRNGSRRYWRPG